MFRRHKYSFHLDFVFFNIICLKDGTDGCRCLLLKPLKGEAMMLPTMLPSVQVLENLNPKSFEYWYGMGFDNMTNTYKIVRVYGCKIADIFGRLNSEYLVSHVYVLGTSSWKEIDSVPSREIIIDKKVSAYGDMHWLTLCSRRVQAVSGHSISILSFDFKKENIPNPPFRKKPGSFPPIERFQLINLSGSLSLVDASSDKYLGIWMLKNYDEKGWILGYRIEGSTLRAESPYKSFRLWTCSEWEHGILFKKSDCSKTRYILFGSKKCFHELCRMSSIGKGIGYERAQLNRRLDFPKKLWESGGTENKYEGS
ncbi:F-box/kelch-repeat protein At3g06240-like [Malus domestica]